MPSTPPLIQSVIRRSNLNRLLLGLAAFAIVALGVVISLRYYANLLQGPAPVTFSQLLSAPNDTLAYGDWVRVEADDVFDTGFQDIESGIGYETVKASYLALQFQNRLLLVKRPGEIKEAEEDLPVSYTGELTYIPPDIQTGVVDELRRDIPNLNDAFFPLLLDASDYRQSSYLGFAILGAVLLFAGFNLVVAFRRMSSPQAHPIMQDLSRFGDLSTTVSQLETELDRPLSIIDQFHFTRNWVVLWRPATFKATRLHDVIWLYPRTVRQRVNGIPAGRRHYVMLHDRYGKTIEYQAKEKTVLAILTAIQQRAPWAITGYSEELNKRWRSDRASLIAAVDRRAVEQRQAAESG